MRPYRYFPHLVAGLAWLGMIGCIGHALAVNEGGHVLSGAVSGASGLRSMIWTNASRAALIVTTLLQVIVLWRLRMIGSTLLRTPGISAELARGFAWLGHVLLVLSIVGLLLPAPQLLRVPGDALIVSERLPFSMLYFSLLGCACAYIAAAALGQSVRIQQENEAFV